MILIIETIEREQIRLALLKSDNIADLVWQEFMTNDQSADLLINIEKILSSDQLMLKDLTAILVNIGPGSYTGVRVGVTTANSLAWGLNIPVMGYKNGEIEMALAEIRQSKDKTFFKIALPLYLDRKTRN